MAVESQFWGQAVDVAGLITGGDIRAALQKIQVAGYAFGVIPGVMLKSGTTQFLDDLTVEDLAGLMRLADSGGTRSLQRPSVCIDGPRALTCMP
jgi:NifB/MoaA-like Fe-S oxidoreductase